MDGSPGGGGGRAIRRGECCRHPSLQGIVNPGAAGTMTLAVGGLSTRSRCGLTAALCGTSRETRREERSARAERHRIRGFAAEPKFLYAVERCTGSEAARGTGVTSARSPRFASVARLRPLRSRPPRSFRSPRSLRPWFSLLFSLAAFVASVAE